MKTLSQYINTPHTDGHIHLFNHEESVDINAISEQTGYERFIGFEDVEFRFLNKYQDGATLEHYKNYIDNHDIKNIILCATGIDSETIINTYKTFPKIIKAFGELKCYDKTKHNKQLLFNNLDWVRDILKYDTTLDKPLPVIIHYNLDSNIKVQRLDNLLSKYDQVPIVLCHCGMPGHEYDSKITDKEIYRVIQKLQNDHLNLWLDVSHSSLDYFYQNNLDLFNLDRSRMYCGTDINPVIYRLEKDEDYIRDTVKKLNSIKAYIRSDENINRLFD